MSQTISVLKRELYKVVRFFYKPRVEYKAISDDVYFTAFGLVRDTVNPTKFKVDDDVKLKLAYDKAWQNRDYEIDKFWVRAAYFWGFIVLIFGGYISVLTSEHNERLIKGKIDFYFIVLGLIFSLAWVLVIRGSKRWQENWEGHIDKLEEYVSGPIYQIVFFKGQRFYSVSKLNEVLAIVIGFVWTGIFVKYCIENEITLFRGKVVWEYFAGLTLLIFTSSAMYFGYCRVEYAASEKVFIDRREHP